MNAKSFDTIKNDQISNSKWHLIFRLKWIGSANRKITFVSLLTAIFLIPLLTSFGQSNECRCNEMFDKDVKDKFESFSSQDAKEILFKYFTSDQKARQSMKNDASLEGSVSTVIKAIPVDIGLKAKSSESKDRYYTFYQESIENRFISDEMLQTLYTSSIPDRIFESYELCLSGCNRAGVVLRNISTQDDLVVLELKFSATPAGGKISINEAIYSGGTVVGGKKFETGREIKDGQVLYEHIKIKPDEDITVSVAFNEGVKYTSALSVKSNNKPRKSTDAPIGTLVASFLNYNDFLKVNGLEYESDINKVIWVPCDGRTVGTAKGTYGAYTGGKVPDLRGLFLRAVNDMGNNNASVPSINPDNSNPEPKQVGQIQSDAFQGHGHTDKSFQSITAHRVNSYSGGGWSHTATMDAGTVDKGFGTPRISTETRPKNVSVFYYIKIR